MNVLTQARNYPGPGIEGVIISFLVIVGLFFLVRSIFLWYWKIDVLVKNQEEQKELLRDQNDLLAKIYRLQSGEKERKTELFDKSQIKGD